jgi:tRNA (cmo5U34)-methyltransferase
MLTKARERLTEFRNIRYIKASFQDLLTTDMFDGKFDLAASSMAIHHLTLEEKEMLFRRIYSWLREGGYFVNIDVVLAPTASIEVWYLRLWRDWMDEEKAAIGLEAEPSDKIIKRYKDLEENKPDTLRDQLDALQEIGFHEVDCFYKYGIFSIYGGRR